MERYCFVLIVLFLLSSWSCSANRELRQERISHEFANWEEKFKDRALCRCVLEGFESNAIADSIKKYDKSFYDPLAIAIFDSALDPLIREQVGLIRADSITNVGRYPTDLKELLEGKRVFRNCVKFYKSKTLDQAAKSEKVKWRKIENILVEIHKTIPTF